MIPGILAVTSPKFSDYDRAQYEILELTQLLAQSEELNQFPLIILVDDSLFTAQHINNFLWVTFTRSNPSHDIYGVNSFIEFKHWGCRGSLIIDARIKPHHAPPLIENPHITSRVNKLGEKGRCLHGII